MKKKILNKNKFLSGFRAMGLTVAVCLGVISCEDDRVGQNPVDDVPPSPISQVSVEALPGGAKITYKLPNEKDISYVRCEYQSNGEKKEVRSSVYNSSLVVNGLADMNPCDFTLYLVDHSENQSEPYKGSFTPLEPPYKTIFKTISMQPDFGGVTIRWKNENKVLIGAFLLAQNDIGEWEEYDLVYSSLEEDKRSIRGYNTDERCFGVMLVDEFGNQSDTVVYTTNPIFEKELDKKKFKNGYLNGDNNSVLKSRPLNNIWDGNRDVIWHTDPSAGFTAPQYFTIDLGVEADLSRFVLFNRTDFSYKQHNPRYFEVWGTRELENPDHNDEYWKNGPWRDNWILLGDFEVVKPSGLPIGQETEEDKAAEKNGFEFMFESGVGKVRYLRFVVKETWARTTALHINEVDIYGNDGSNE